MAVYYQHPRLTRAALNSKASGSTLLVGMVYLITDEDRLAVALTTSTYATYVKETELSAAKTGSLPVLIDGGGVVIAAGQYAVVSDFPFAATITGWTLASDTSTTSVITVSKATYANFPTWTEISGTEDPSLTAAQKNQDNTLTTWTTSLSQGDFLKINVDSNNNAKQLFLNIRYTRT